MKVKNAVTQLGISLVVISLCGFSCKKADSTLTSALPSLTSTEQAQVLNADNQDAVADRTDQDVDKALDVLQNNNYNSNNTALKADASFTITVDHPDSTTFPKVITLTFNNYIDTAASEIYTKNGTITVTVTVDSANPKYVIRTQMFNNFSFSTDSSSFTINGTRIVTRKSITTKFNGLKSFRSSIVDDIKATLQYKTTIGTVVESFTRVVAKTRTATVHYKNVSTASIPTWKNVKFVNDINSDSVTYSGEVSGVNEKGNLYTKTVLAASPLVVTFYQTAPVISSGTMEYTVTDSTTKQTSKYTLLFVQSTTNPHKTSVTVTNDSNAKTFTYVSRLKRKFIKY